MSLFFPNFDVLNIGGQYYIMLTVAEDPLSGNLSSQFIIIFVLILLNAFFAAAELAILSANPVKLKIAEKKNKKAILVQKLQENETKFLSTIQVGITLAGFFSSATAAVSLSSGLAISLANINVPYASQIALIIVTLILSYFTLVFGELFPKRIALKAPEKVAMMLARPISIIKTLFRPIVFVLSGSCELLVKLFRLKPNDDDKITEEEIKAFVDSGLDDGAINQGEKTLINAVLSYGDVNARDMMKPRIDVFCINLSNPIEKIKKEIFEEKYTRIPIYIDDKDNIIGVLNIKDIFLHLQDKPVTKEIIQEVMRTPVFIPDNMKADNIFKILQKNKEHAAIVIDESGGFVGFVTMEDLIEEIMGNIYDEYDDNADIVQVSENTYLVDGSIPINELNRYLHINLTNEDEDFSSLAGFIFSMIERIPTKEENLEIQYHHINLKIEDIQHNRILKVLITIGEEQDNN